MAAESDSKATSQERLLLVRGAPGTVEYGKRFTVWADRWQAAAHEQGLTHHAIGTSPSEIGGDVSGAKKPTETESRGASPTEKAIADKERLRNALQEVRPDGPHPLWLVLIGHGTFDGRHAKFNLEGPDVSATELAQWLEPFNRPLIVVNCASASGPFIDKLSAANRIIITATQSGSEESFARFGQYFSNAITGQEADLDRDAQVSVLEAFIYAGHKTAEYYDSQGQLATEHPLLDDNGDGRGTRADWFQGIYPAKKPEGQQEVDGRLAHQFHFIETGEEKQLSNELRARRSKLEEKIYHLRQKKSELSEDEYYRRLEPILIQLARLYEQESGSASIDEGKNHQ